MLSATNVKNNEIVYKQFERSSYYNDKIFMSSILIISLIGIAVLYFKPEFYVQETLDNASNYLYFQIILARLPLGIGAGGILFMLSVNVYYLVKNYLCNMDLDDN